MNMRVVHICNTDIRGGAGIAANRLHRALLEAGVDSMMFVLSKKGHDPSVIQASRGRIKSKWVRYSDNLERKALGGLMEETQTVWSRSFLPCFNVSDINKLRPDVVHLHWINWGTLSIGELAGLRTNKIVWSLHDVWPFSGGRHYTGCYSRKISSRKLQAYADQLEDLIREKKYKAWENLPITWVPLSSWMENELYRSTLRMNKPSKMIWNSVPLDTFHACAQADKLRLREEFLVEAEKLVFLFGAFSANSDLRKGGDLLEQAILELPRIDGSEGNVPWFVSFGGDTYHYRTENGYVMHGLGKYEGDALLAKVYGIADVYICPSREDNLPNTCLEAIASGLPVVAFDVGGLSDIVVPEVSGSLVQPFSISDFSREIQRFILNPDLSKSLGLRARKLCEDRFSKQRQVDAFRKLYQE